jgi:hypothetical protein
MLILPLPLPLTLTLRYIVPRGPTGGVAHGTVGLLKKAVALVGSGAKGLDWFEFGPEDFFPGNCWSVRCADFR